MVAIGLLILMFFTLPIGISEGQPLLIMIPIAAIAAAFMLGG